MPKSGIKTTEFWMALIAMGATTALEAFKSGAAEGGGAGKHAYVLGGIAAVYALARMAVKTFGKKE